MRRRSLVSLAPLLACIVVASAYGDLENQVFTSKPDELRMVVPRGWRATDQPSYPDQLLWMMHGQPDAHIVLTAEPFTRKLYCSWPIQCRTSHDALPSKLACALRARLEAHKLRVGPIQAGPRENEDAGMPTVWFEYDDGKHYFRQAVALTSDRAVSLLLSTQSLDARTGYVRAFEAALRTLRPLTAEEESAAAAAAPAAPSDAGVPDAPPSAPGPEINPVGSCAQ